MMCEDCGGDLHDARMRWHRWCGPARRGGLPIDRPPDVLLPDAAALDRLKVVGMSTLEQAHQAGDGHLVAKLLRPVAALMHDDHDEAGVMEAIQALDAQPQLFPVPDVEVA